MSRARAHYLDGIDLATLDAKHKARFRSESIGFMFQFHHLLTEFTAVENVMMPFSSLRFGGRMLTHKRGLGSIG